jgi:hypothetical protein
VVVNHGTRCTFILDTGASMTLIAPAAARRLRAAPVKVSGRTVSLSGRVKATEVELDALALGPVTVRGLRVIVADLRVIRRAVGVDIDGVLGSDVLARFRVVIDYPNRRVSFAPPRDRRGRR